MRFCFFLFLLVLNQIFQNLSVDDNTIVVQETDDEEEGEKENGISSHDNKKEKKTRKRKMTIIESAFAEGSPGIA